MYWGTPPQSRADFSRFTLYYKLGKSLKIKQNKTITINVPLFKGAQAWDIPSLGFSWFLQNKVFLGRWFGGKNINLILKFLRELRRI
jgi:hypothetical protein